MTKIIQKIKASTKGIHWPSKKEILTDTVFVMSVATTLSLLIVGWTSVVDLIIGLFI